jgi:photosystem II stability/assembly factor-like uncharacterized protein
MPSKDLIESRRRHVLAAVWAIVSLGLGTPETFGASWERLNFDLPGSTFYFVTVDPKDSNTVYVGTSSGVSKSTDGGTSWKALRVGNAALVAIEMAVSLQQSTTLYAAAPTEVLKSVDGGETWQVTGPGLSGDLASLAIDPQNGDIVYVAQACSPVSCKPSVFKTVNGGASWTPSSNTLSDPACGWSVNDLAVHPTNSNKVYATTDDCGNSQPGLGWKSVDGGITWSTIRLGLGYYSTIVIDPQAPDTLYAGAFGGVSKSEDGGETWFNINVGLPPAFELSSLVIDPRFPSRLYAGSYVGSGFIKIPSGFGVFRSINGGATWAQIYDGLGSPPILDLAISSSYPKIVFAATENAIFKLVDSIVDLPLVGDLNGDSKSDVLWRNTERDPHAWLMNGMAIHSRGALPTLPAGWSTSGVGDFNGDGRDDVVRRRISGEVEVSFMDGERIASSTIVGNVWIGWTISRMGDFDGDGRDDILWRSENGEVAIWLMDGTRISSFHTVANTPTHWTISGVGDFNGDDRADILWRSTSGEVVMWLMNGVRITSSHSVANIWVGWSITGVGDFDADRRADILWQEAGGNVVIWKMDGSRIVGYSQVSE